MSMNVIALFPHRVQPAPPPVYLIKWLTETGCLRCKSTSDAHSIRRQLTSCMRRGLPAVVFEGMQARTRDICGGVVETHALDGSITARATFLEESWGV